jgi:hypothetical protein
MITLPPGFDVSTLFTDFISMAVPFMPVIALFTAYALIKRSMARI